MPKKLSIVEIQAMADALNERQQTYLRVLFENTDGVKRWAEYGPVGFSKVLYDGPLRSRLDRVQLVDSGSGATWKVLRVRQLVELEYRYTGRRASRDGRWIDSLWVKLTLNGQRLTRHLLGEEIDPVRPKIKPLSLTALRLLECAQRHPTKDIEWREPWKGRSWEPLFYIAEACARGLVKRGLLKVSGCGWRVTPAGAAVDVRAEENWREFWRDPDSSSATPAVAGQSTPAIQVTEIVQGQSDAVQAKD